ncbi:MAG TPA: helix-turn-helix transcriptional regulator [Panacibacter sp.]|nr:helix-turn-helix transcriptional regulator [Panacibacter sp.]HNP45449.1 helix-turn-helix transcriptional regulator [Panacibacter sp.]
MGDNNNAFAAQMLHSGKLIRKLRIEKKMSQLQLAERCYMQKSSISKLEAGLSNPTVFTLHKISVVLEVPINELF